LKAIARVEFASVGLEILPSWMMLGSNEFGISPHFMMVCSTKYSDTWAFDVIEIPGLSLEDFLCSPNFIAPPLKCIICSVSFTTP
jgi:hypothetical protein